MIRDQGPVYVTGFGTTSRDLPLTQREDKGSSSESGYLSKRLNNHPFARFALYNTLAVAGMAVAGALVKSGGVKLTQRWGRELIKDGSYVVRADGELPIRTQVVHGVRKLQKMFDEWQGIERYLPDLQGLEGEVSLQRDSLFNANIFDFANEQFGAPSKNVDFFDRLRASRAGPNVQGDIRWKDFYQQSLIRQARRLPYELPALYATQRGVLDPLFGSDKERPKWYNPLDVLSDFGLESAKNAAFLLMPLEVGPAAVREKYRRFMASASYVGNDARMLARGQKAVLLQEQLSLLGQDFSSMLSKVAQFSSRTTGAFGAAIGESVNRDRGIVQQLHAAKSSARLEGRKVGFFDIFNREAADIRVGPFGGTGSFFGTFREAFRTWTRPTGTTDFEMAADAIGGLSGFTRSRKGEFFEKMLNEARRSMPEAEFRANRSQIESDIDQQWKRVYSDQIIPWLRESRLKKIPLRSDALQVIDQPGMDEVVREIAEASGFSRDFVQSSPIATVRNRLRQLGHRIDDVDYVKSFLQSHGRIQPEWGKGGFNVLGLRPLSVQRAMTTGFFEGVGNQRMRLLRQLRDDLVPQQLRDAGGTIMGSPLDRLSVGKGVFETRGGGVVDVTAIMRSFGRAMDVFEQQFKIPFIQLNPASLFRWGDVAASRRSPMIQMLTGSDSPGFINPRLKGALSSSGETLFQEGKLGENEALFLLKENRAKGTLFRTSRVGRATYSQDIPGKFRSMRINDYMEQALGSQGFDSVGDAERSRFKRLFSVSEDQPQSIFGFFSRWKQRIFRTGSLDRFGQPTDIRNPRAYADMLLRGGLGDFTEEQRVSAIETLLNSLRNKGIPRSALENLKDIDRNSPGAARIASFLDGLLPQTTQAGRATLESAEGLRTTDEFREFLVNFVAQKNPRSLTTNVRQQEILRELQDPIRNFLRRIDADPGFIEEAIKDPGLNRIGIHRRQDMIRNALYKYFIAEQAILSPMDSAEILESLTTSGQKLLSEGKITGKELAEFRSAILGIHADIVQAGRNAARGTGRISREQGLLRLERKLSGLPANSPLREALAGYARFDDKVGLNIGFTDPSLAGSARGGPFELKRLFHRLMSTAEYQKPGVESSAFGGASRTFVPTTGTVLAQRPFGALKSILGINTDVSPLDWSAGSLPSTILVKRLNRYFGTFGLGLKETDFRGPLDLYARGMVGKRVLPIVAAGTTVLAADATIGGIVNKKDEQGKRRYSPFFLGGAARGVAYGQAALAGLIPGGQSFSEKKKELFEGEVPVRRGRWWALGNTPWRGDRIQYFRPSWYRRFTGGAQYTGQSWNSPIEKLLFGYDYSPLRPLDPYRYERKHYADRPYPVTGEYFSGPWGPLTGLLNATVGQVLKPRKFMHQQEMRNVLSGYTAAGYYGAQPGQQIGNAPRVLYRTAKRQTVQSAQNISGVLGYPHLMPGMTSFGNASGTAPYATSDSVRIKRRSSPSVLQSVSVPVAMDRKANFAGKASIAPDNRGLARIPGGIAFGSGEIDPQAHLIDKSVSPSRATNISRNVLLGLNQTYAEAASRPILGRREAYQYPMMVSTSGMKERIIPRAKPISQSGFDYQKSMFGYQVQELGGIYGFGFGSAREALGLGTQDFSKRRPVLMSAARAYGTERSFWDLGLGGLGDLPTPLEGEYSNLEISEIVRRFIPHRRRDENEINPIPNTMAQKAPWLPGSDYFMNFQQGDPYVKIAEGESRLPGAAYERFNKLHSDSTGRYGLLDKLKILGDVAPWSNQYKAVEKAIQLTDLNERDKKYVSRIKDQVRQKKKTIEFAPYQYSKQKFDTREARILGFVPGRADQFYTDQFAQPIRLSGVRASRANKAQPAQDYVKRFVRPGSKVSITYDANKGPLFGPTKTIDAYVKADGKSLNEQLMQSGYAKKATTYTPLDRYMQESPVQKITGKIKEGLFHRNTLFNAKFLPYRTPVEDWERRNVYGATFPQWQHPIRDFVKPVVYKAANRDIVTATVGTAAVGSMFGKLPGGRRVGGIVGGLTGFTTSLLTNARSYETGERFVPKTRKKELALEEYMDILKYVKYSRLYSAARQAAIAREGVDPESLMRDLPEGSRRFTPVGPITQQAIQFQKEKKRTLYGADPNGDVMDAYYAMPKRKRPYFMEFLKAPLSDRARILSTAPRLERRIYESRWGLKVEKRPDLTAYFKERELPGPEWEGWRPDVDLETVKLKVANHMGLDASQMGYYPQQIKEANLLNPSYPDINARQNPAEVERKLRALLYANNINGNVRAIPSHSRGSRVEFNAVV